MPEDGWAGSQPVAREGHPADLSAWDVDLHGIVRVRLLEAELRDVRAVQRQLGLPVGPVQGEADLTVRFVHDLEPGPLSYVGVGDAAFDARTFYLLDRRTGSAQASLPFDRLDQTGEVVCLSGIAAVPHLLAMINLAALAKGVLPLHASAFSLGGAGVLVTGWSKSGKTEALVAAARRGAHYVGDEWVYLTPDGMMHGLPEPVRLWAWHLDQLDEVRLARSGTERRRIAAWRFLDRLAGTVSRTGVAPTVLAKARPVLARQSYVRVPPPELFGEQAVDLRGRLDAAVLMVSHASPEITTTTAAHGETSARMAASLADERAAFLAHYRQFRYAFPERSSEAVERAEQRERSLLARHFDDRPVAKVCHPYPCDLTALGNAVLSAVQDRLQSPATPPHNEMVTT